MSEFATEQTLFKESVQVCKNNIFNRIIAPCYENDVVDIEKLREELKNYKPTDIVGTTILERAFSQIYRQIEHNIIVHLATNLKDEHSDIDKLADMYEKLNVITPVQGAAPYVHVEVASRSIKQTENGKPTLTRFDDLKERTTIALTLVTDKQGRHINPNTNSVWIKGSNGHWLCVGCVKGNETGPITSEVVAFCKQYNKLYDASKVAM